MDVKFDHIIHFMNDPKQGMEELQKRGIHAVNGGSHEKRGSFNTLSHFGLKYIELLGIDNEELFNRAGATELAYSPFEEIAKNNFREGFAKINLRTSNLKELAKKLNSHGIKTNGPIPLSRRKPDGSLLEWELLYAGGHPGELPLPFFINWGESDEKRYQTLKEDGTIADHRVGELQLSSILFAVNDARKTASLWKSLFELEACPSYIDENLQATGYPLRLDDIIFTFAEPLEQDRGRIAKALNEMGEHPYLITIKGAKEEDDFTIFGGHYELNK